MRILFIGNSHTYFNDMPQLFRRMCDALTGDTPEVTMLAYSDRSLSWHREEYFAVRFALLYGQYDYCVLQQQAHPFPGEDETFAAAERIARLCAAGGARPVVYMTWAQRAEPEMTAVMSRCYRALAARLDAPLIPVGEAFALAQRERPDIDLYWHDGAHASPYGDYLIAALLAGRLCGCADLAPLDDAAIDFRCDFAGEDGLPLALEDAAAAAVTLDADKAAALCAVAERLLREA